MVVGITVLVICNTKDMEREKPGDVISSTDIVTKDSDKQSNEQVNNNVEQEVSESIDGVTEDAFVSEVSNATDKTNDTTSQMQNNSTINDGKETAGGKNMQTIHEYLKKNYTKQCNVEEVHFSFPKEYTNISAVMYGVGKENKVFAFIGYPNTPMPEGGYPAVVLIHGGGGYAFYEWVKEWTDKGYVAIAPDFYGQKPQDGVNFSNRKFYAGTDDMRKARNELGGPTGWGSFEQVHSDNPWIYFSVMNAISAVDVLSNDTKVNPNKICATGISWGGVILLITCSVEERIKAASVIYSSAFISDTKWGMDSGIATLSQADRKLYDTYYDPQTYLKNISCPVFFAGGTNDHAFSFYNRKRTYQSIESPIYLGLRHFFAHDHECGWEGNEQVSFFNSVLNQQEFPIVNVIQTQDKIQALCKFVPQRLVCVYTSEDVIHTDMCEWEELEIKKFEEFTLPESARAFFIEAVTEQGLRISSDLYLK